jgi:hypothetical protein
VTRRVTITSKVVFDPAALRRRIRSALLIGMWRGGLCSYCGAKAAPGEEAVHLEECGGMEALDATDALAEELERLVSHMAGVRATLPGRSG